MVLFLLDGTKQLLSSGLLHITNIAFSVVIGSTQNDQCGIYLMTFVVDISLGILICYYLLKLVDKILSYRKSKVPACSPETQERQLLHQVAAGGRLIRGDHRLLCVV